MHKHATILIPDISGYTELFSQTPLEFSTALLAELLNELMSVAKDKFRVAEIEGDAILFYVKGKKLPAKELISYCVRAYTHFHVYLNTVLSRITDPEMRRHVAPLTVKFIVHWGPIGEISVANFTKPVGLSLIKAHKLLKNSINSSAYILLTEEFAEGQTAKDWYLEKAKQLEWQEGEEVYEIIGTVRYFFALLNGNVIP